MCVPFTLFHHTTHTHTHALLDDPGAATHELLSKLLLGAAEQARAKQGKGGGKASTVVTITPEDM